MRNPSYLTATTILNLLRRFLLIFSAVSLSNGSEYLPELSRRFSPDDAFRRRLLNPSAVVATCKPVGYFCGDSDMVLDDTYDAVTQGVCTHNQGGPHGPALLQRPEHMENCVFEESL
jgi:hypothetical protein